MVRMSLWISALILTGCVSLPLSPTSVGKLNPMEIDILTDVAANVQRCKAVQGFHFTPCVDGDVEAALRRLVHVIRVQRFPSVFPCGSVDEAVGCWSVGIRLLRYDTSGRIYSVDGTLTHEFLHAILSELGDPRTWCSLHDFNNNQIWDCYE